MRKIIRKIFYLFLSTGFLLPFLMANEEIDIAYQNDNPDYVEMWLKKNKDKSIKDFKIPVHKYNISKKAIEHGAKWYNNTQIIKLY